MTRAQSGAAAPGGVALPARRRRWTAAVWGRELQSLLVATITALGVLVAGCASGVPPLPTVPERWTEPPPPARPPACSEVAAVDDLALRLAAARPGDALCLAPGDYRGPFHVGAGVTLWGPRSARLSSAGSGDTVGLSGAGARLLGVTVDGSGSRFDLQEAAVHVVAADHARVEGVRVVHALFGIIVEKSREVVLAGNEIEGSGRAEIGLRGDGIRIWETQASTIADNRVSGARDIVIWYSSDNDLRGNEVVGGRYGTHFMYSHGNRVIGNRYVGNVVGIFVMYSRDLEIENNLLAASSGAAGMGLGLKEASHVRAADNVLVRNNLGLFIDNSPFEPGTSDEFRGNAFRLCDVGIEFHASMRGNVFRANSLRGNVVQVRVAGGGDALGNDWEGNDFDDYAGYDLDGDGVGDVPYELRSFSGSLAARHPQLDYLRGSPALFLVDAASRLLPIVRPAPVLVDRRPDAGRAVHPVRTASGVAGAD
ncbi:MAG: nitrous oxide reductase family maturation protein NosD [Myxococcales bacterium]|nr:nitrous oxide reductase family maturation protein NosD [Myxococcales bacterium]